MILSSRHRIRNSSPGGLRPSTLPLGHGGSPQYWLSHVDGEETFLVSFKPPRPRTEPRTLTWKAVVLTTTLWPPPMIVIIISTPLGREGFLCLGGVQVTGTWWVTQTDEHVLSHWARAVTECDTVILWRHSEYWVTDGHSEERGGAYRGQVLRGGVVTRNDRQPRHMMWCARRRAHTGTSLSTNQETFTRCSFNAGPSSQTMAQH